MITRLARICVSALVVVCVLVRSAQAQAQEDPRAKAPMHLGILYLTPSLELKGFGVDRNVFNSAENQKADVTLEPLLGLTGFVPMGRVRLGISSQADYVYYRTYASERQTNWNLGQDGEIDLGRLMLSASNSYLHTRQRPNYEIDVRPGRVENGIQVGVRLRVFKKLSAQAFARQDTVAFDSGAEFRGVSLSRQLDRRSNTVGLALTHAVTRLTSISLNAEGTLDRFDKSPARDSRSLRLMPTVSFKPLALVSGHASVGYQRIRGMDPAFPNLQGPIASADLSYVLLGVTQFGGEVQRGTTYSYDQRFPYFVDTTYGGTIQQQLVARLDLKLEAQKFAYDYKRLNGESLARVSRLDSGGKYRLQVGFRLSRDSRLAVGASYTSRKSNFAEFNYDGLGLETIMTYKVK